MVGSHYVLSIIPGLALFVLLYGGPMAFLYFGRKLLEKRDYNVSFSSRYGTLALILGIIIAASTLKHERIEVTWLASRTYHMLCLGVAAMAGLVALVFDLTQKRKGRGLIIDVINSGVIVPLFAYLVLTALPITFTQGNRDDVALTGISVTIWLALFVYDVVDGRIHQRDWIAEHGEPWNFYRERY
jgi:hypothetical protein